MSGTVRAFARHALFLILFAGFWAACAAAPCQALAAVNRQHQPPSPETRALEKSYRLVAHQAVGAITDRKNTAFAGMKNAAGTGPETATRDQSLVNGLVLAAGPVRGIGALGPGPPAQPAPPPRPAYGGTPGDYARGYEGMSPTPGDFWHRESDFRARDYTTRHGPPPAYAAPSRPPVGGKGERVIEPYDPLLPRPPLPGDSDPPVRVIPVAPGAAP